MSRTKQYIAVLTCAVLAWLLMVVFSYEFVSKHTNQANQNKFTEIEQLNWSHQWAFEDKSAIVKSFATAWQADQGGVTTSIANPEISLQMNGAVIDPSLQQQLVIQFKLDRKAEKTDTFKLEFSNQQQQDYYVTEELSLGILDDAIDLTQLRWRVLELKGKRQHERFVNWTEIPILDALVIRFYLSKDSTLLIKDIAINQNIVRRWIDQPFVSCDVFYPSTTECLVTNQMRFLQSEYNQFNNNQYIKFERISESSSPFFWLGFAWLVMSIMALFSSGHKAVSLWVCLSVFALIALFHYPGFIASINTLRWALLGFCLALVWYQRRWFKWPKNVASAVWLTSLILAALMLVVSNHFEFEFELAFLQHFILYFMWACIQQLMLGPLVSQVLLKHLSDNKWVVACVVGVLFSVIHAPNHALMLSTLVAGIAWSYSWLKYKNIYANAFSHALLALVFYSVMPPEWLGSARIGLFF